MATRWNNLGSAWYSLGKYEKAIEYYEKALASGIKSFGKEHPKVALRWNNLGSAWDSLGKYEKALKIFVTFLEKDHPNTKVVRDNLEFTIEKLKQ